MLDLLLEDTNFDNDEDLQELDDIIQDIEDIKNEIVDGVDVDLGPDENDDEDYFPPEDDNDSSDIKVSLKKEEDSSEEIKVNLKNEEDLGPEDSDTISVTITDFKQDDIENASDEDVKKLAKKYYNSEKPEDQISSCLKMLLDTNQSLEKMITYVPKNTTIIKTKNTIQNLLTAITEEHDSIVSDDVKAAKISIQVYDVIQILTKYLKDNREKLLQELKNNTEN